MMIIMSRHGVEMVRSTTDGIKSSGDFHLRLIIHNKSFFNVATCNWCVTFRLLQDRQSY